MQELISATMYTTQHNERNTQHIARCIKLQYNTQKKTRTEQIKYLKCSNHVPFNNLLKGDDAIKPLSSSE